MLLQECLQYVVFYGDRATPKSYYAEFEDEKEMTIFASIHSEIFKGFLIELSEKLSDYELSLDADPVVKRLQCSCSYLKNYTKTDIHIRMCGSLYAGNIQYDLQNRSQKVVSIDKEDWRFVNKADDTTKKFVTSDYSLPQVMPKRTTESPLTLLRPYLNVNDDQFKLFVVWLCQALSAGSHHALLLLGDKGAGKTSLCNLTMKLLNPFEFTVTHMPSKVDDLLVLLHNAPVCAFDNIEDINNQGSNALCQAVTGSASVKRSLYTNNDLSISRFHNTIILNGIDVIPEKDDLKERLLYLKLQKFTSDNIIREDELWENFENDRPYILGSIFLTLSGAMKMTDEPMPTYKPRMLRAFQEMVLIARALGIPDDEFVRIYNDNVEELKQLGKTKPVIVSAVKEYLCKYNGRKVVKPSEQMYKDIYSDFSGDKSSFPNGASEFSKQLEEHQAELRKENIRLIIDDTGAQCSTITFIKTSAFGKEKKTA